LTIFSAGDKKNSERAAFEVVARAALVLGTPLNLVYQKLNKANVFQVMDSGFAGWFCGLAIYRG